ncbi:hypothetical protein LINPERPRIM_LOCUS41186 [Linum perenne]
MKRMSRIKGLNHRAAAADCMEEVEDAVEELGNSVAEMVGFRVKDPSFAG